jgi:hypothetical protein
MQSGGQSSRQQYSRCYMQYALILIQVDFPMLISCNVTTQVPATSSARLIVS